MIQKNEEIIKNMPKVILHLHLDGSLRPETVYSWLKEKGEEITLEEVKKKLMVEEGCQDLNQYLEKFDLPVGLLQSEEHIKQATYELFTDLAKQNVIYAEIRFAPSLHTRQGLNFSQIVQAAIEGMNKAKQETSIEGNLILCCMRGKNNQRNNFETVEVARKFLGKGVVALDLAGAEAIFPTGDYKDIFIKAKELNIPYTIHAGEAAGAESIKKAIELGAKRIGHGVRCLEYTALVAQLKQKEIPLEICPISNLHTRATAEPHPIEKIYKRGIPVTVSPDNMTVSNTNLQREYEWILGNTSLTIPDIFRMNIMAIRGAFVSTQMKAKLIGEITGYRDIIIREENERNF